MRRDQSLLAARGLRSDDQREALSASPTSQVHPRPRYRLPSALCKPSLRTYFDWDDSGNDDYANRPVLLDLFAGGGGAALGYYLSGFRIVGVDHRPQPRYPFEFHQADALEYVREHGQEFDAIHASPPCQFASTITPDQTIHENLIPATRRAIADRPYVIENVMPARQHLRHPVKLCGIDFGLGVIRHRLFETNWLCMVPVCSGRCKAAVTEGRAINVVGGGVPKWWWDRPQWRAMRRATAPDHPLCYTTEERQAALGIDWMTRPELSQAIPPAYTEFIGRQLLQALGAREAGG